MIRRGGVERKEEWKRGKRVEGDTGARENKQVSECVYLCVVNLLRGLDTVEEQRDILGALLAFREQCFECVDVVIEHRLRREEHVLEG